MIKFVRSAIVLCCLVSYISAGEIPKEFVEVAPEIRRICTAETNIDLDIVDRAAKGDLVDDDKLKCYMKCQLRQFGLISRKGVNHQLFIKTAPPYMKEAAMQVSEACKDIQPLKPGDQCDLAFQMAKCWVKTSPDTFFIM